jgi:hypothetical protein
VSCTATTGFRLTSFLMFSPFFDESKAQSTLCRLTVNSPPDWVFRGLFFLKAV